MMFRHRKLFLFCAIFSLFLIITIIQWRTSENLSNFQNFDNINGHYKNIIPNIVHYVIFGKNKLDFATYLSILSCTKFQKPSILYIHTDKKKFDGKYWQKILEINTTTPVIKLIYFSRPTHVYGQLLSSIYHSTDVARILVLQTWGGIYLDTDTIVLKSLDPFRKYEMVVGWPKKEYMGTQVLLANKNARFLRAWLRGYQRYKPSSWYYNAGQYPTQQLLEKHSYLAHTVPELFGVQNLLDELYKSNDWSQWKQYYTIHLLSRHPPAPEYFKESLINNMNNTFGEIARYILYS